MIFRPRPVRDVVITTLLLVSFAIVPSVPAAPTAPPSRTSIGPDGHWVRLFDDVPFDAWGKFVTATNRVLLVSPKGLWELPFTEPLAWKKISTPTGEFGNRFVYDPVGDRVLSISWATTPGDSMHVRQLPLSNPTEWLELSSVGAPIWGTWRWNPWTAVFDPGSSAIEILGGSIWDGQTLLEVGWGTLATVDGSSVSFAPVTSALGTATYFVDAVDPTRRRLMVYGGYVGHFDNPYTYTAPLGSLSFERLATIGTTPPYQGSAVYDPVRDRMLFHAYWFTPRLWELGLYLSPPGRWLELPTNGNGPASVVQSLVYDPLNDRVLGFGTVHHVWTLNPISATWADRTELPDGTPGRVIVGDANSGRLVYHASGNDLWTVLTTPPFTWSRLTADGTPPPSRRDHEGVYDSARDRMIIFGGRVNTSNPPMNNVWALSLDASPKWSEIVPAGTPPAARYWPSAIYDPVGDRMLVWGGTDGPTQYTDLWQLTLSGTPQWSALSPVGTAPGYIENANAIYDPVRERMLIVGGTSSGEIWALTLTDPPEWSALPTCPGSNVNAFYDQVLDRLVAINNSGDLYALSLASPDAWQPLAPGGPKPASVSASIFVAEATGTRALIWPTDGSAYAYSLEFVGELATPVEAPARRVTLSAISPNPVLAAAMVRMALPAEAEVTLDVFDASGRRVRRLTEGRMPAGEHPVSWDLRDAAGRPVGPGVFLYALTVGRERLTRRVVVLR